MSELYAIEDDGYRRSWQAMSIDHVLEDSYAPPEATVGKRSDAVGLFYRGKVHTVSSESEGGKTWFMLSTVIDELDHAEHVVYVDFEDDEGGIVGRLLALGAAPDSLRKLFHYVRPEDALGGGVHLDDFSTLLADTKPSLGVVDGVTEAMTLHGLSPNDNTDVAKFGRMLPKRLAAAGAASVSLDHVTKSSETRGRYSIGAVHKLNGLDGAAYVLENRSSFGVGLTGRSTLRIAKDRPGQLRKHALTSAGGMHWMGDLVLTSYKEGFVEASVDAPAEQSAEDFRPTHLMGEICRVLGEKGPLSANKIEALIKGKAANIRTARTLLQIDGYVSDGTPHALLKPWDGGGKGV